MSREDDIKELCADAINEIPSQELLGAMALVKGIEGTQFQGWLFLVSEFGWDVMIPQSMQFLKEEFNAVGTTSSDKLALSIEHVYQWQENITRMGINLSAEASA